jgi:hypothetical protein
MTTPITPEQVVTAEEAHEAAEHSFMCLDIEDCASCRRCESTMHRFIDQSAKRVELEREHNALLDRHHEEIKREQALTASLQKAQQQEEQWRNTASATAAELLAARASLQKAREMMLCARSSRRVPCCAVEAAWLGGNPVERCACAPCASWRETGKEGGA